MADNYLDPEQAQPQQQGPPPGISGGGLADAWRGFISDPGNRAFMMQAGIAMMQPRPVGQSTLGHIASSLGSGGEASQRVTRQQMAEEEAASKAEDRSALSTARMAQADAATTRAEAAMLRAQTYQQFGPRGGGGASELGLRNTWIKLLDERADPTGLRPPSPVMKMVADQLGVTVDELKANPELRERGYQLFRNIAPSPQMSTPGLQGKIDQQKQNPARTSTGAPTVAPQASTPKVMGDTELQQQGLLLDPLTQETIQALSDPRARDPMKRKQIIDLFVQKGGKLEDLGGM